jgi:hypothetical protein
MAEGLLVVLKRRFAKHWRVKARIENSLTNYRYNKDWQTAGRLGLKALKEIHPIEESGVVPWLETDRLSSIDYDAEYWARRVMTRVYDYDTGERGTVKAIALHTPQQTFPLTRQQATQVVSQLVDELNEWDEE